MPELILEKRLFDYLGLGIKGLPERWLAYPKDIGLMLALLQGMGPDGAKLVNVSALGNLGLSLADVGGVAVPNQVNAPGWLPVTLFDAGANPLNRATATQLAAFSSGAALQAITPGEWSLTQLGAIGAQATVSRAAGGVGVRHVCRSIDFSAVAAAAPAAQALAINLRDGASGAGTILRSWAVFVLAAIGQSVPPFALTGLNIVGSPNTAMTMEFANLVANVQQNVGLSGFDAS